MSASDEIPPTATVSDTVAVTVAVTPPDAPPDAPNARATGRVESDPLEIALTEVGPVVFEATPIGPQALVTGVAPITPRDRLAWRANAPMQPRKPQRPADHGLFDTNARNQMEMFG